MPEALSDLFGPMGGDDAPGPLEAAARLALAAVLGWAVSGFYAVSARRRPEALDLGGTLVLLTMLIAMVTMAVGQNAAIAFTLVGTLAIVRFRTTVRDIRDTAFVIFAVAVGIAIGAANPSVALIGTVLVGLVSVIITHSSDAAALKAPIAGRLSLKLKGAGPHEPTIDPVLDGAVRTYRILEARVDREGNTRLEYEIDCDRSAAGQLLATLHAVDAVMRVSASFGTDSEE